MSNFDLGSDSDAENSLGRLQAALTVPNLREAVCRYFDHYESFAGLTFDSLGRNLPNEITADDLLAVTLLDVSWTPPAVRAMLEDQTEKFGMLLRGIDSHTTLWAPDAGRQLCAAEAMWEELRTLPGVGRTKAGKLLARKRPLLVPIVDDVIARAVGNSGKTWLTLRHCFQNDAFRESVEALRPTGTEDISMLRIFDVAIWMLCSRSRAARATRNQTGVVEGMPPSGRSAGA
jgi:hypothetical protein